MEEGISRNDFLLLISKVIIYSFFPIINKYFLHTNLSQFQVIMVSTIVSFSVYIPIILRQKLRNEWKKRDKQQRGAVLGLSMISGVLLPIISLTALKHLDTSTYAITNALGIAISYMIIGLVLKKEDTSLLKTIAVIIMTTGILIGIGGFATFRHSPYLFLLLLGLVLAPFAQMFRKKAMRSSTITAVLVFTTGTALITQSCLSMANGDTRQLSSRIFLAIIGFSYLKLILKYIDNYLVKKIDITKRIVFSGVKPMFTVVFSYILIGTSIYHHNFIGLFIAFFGIFLFHKKAKK